MVAVRRLAETDVNVGGAVKTRAAQLRAEAERVARSWLNFERREGVVKAIFAQADTTAVSTVEEWDVDGGGADEEVEESEEAPGGDPRGGKESNVLEKLVTLLEQRQPAAGPAADAAHSKEDALGVDRRERAERLQEKTKYLTPADKGFWRE
eukprot:gene12848-19635_t